MNLTFTFSKIDLCQGVLRLLNTWRQGQRRGGCAPPCIPLHPGPPDPLHSVDPPKGASRRFAPAVENLGTREVLDPGFNVQDRADLPLAIQMDSWVHGILDSEPPAPRAFYAQIKRS